MSHSALTVEEKAAIKANLELELKARREKLVAMCDAQVTSLRSRLERRVNRIPSSKRNMKLIDLLDSAMPAPAKPVRPAPVQREAVSAPAPASTRAAAPVAAVAPAAASRKTRAAPAKPVAKSAPKVTRGKKRPSDDGDKENEELSVPKKRAKTVAPAPVKPTAAANARSTRAASRKAAPQAPQVLSPKPNNSRPAPRARRQR